jgi:Uma2 family endonuclease
MNVVPLPGAYRLTYRDWLGFPDDGRLYELLGGELFVNPPPSVRHQRVSREIQVRLIRHLDTGGRGEVLSAPVGVRLADEDVLEPDLVVVLAEHADRVGEQAILGPPDLVVEILSPGSAGRDLGAKRDAYQRAGVAENWIVDPQAATVEVLALVSGIYERHGLFGRADVLESRLLPDLSLTLSDVFPR